MLKFFKDYSLTGVVLIFSTFALAVILRVTNLSAQSPWTDELASFYFLRHLSQVFEHESHSPLYYAVLRLVLGSEASLLSIRFFSAILSIIHLVVAFFIGQRIFTKNQMLLFWIFICLNPLDIIYARMGRHYGWLLESVLIFALWIRVSAPTWWVSFWAAILGFVHVFAIIPVFLLSLFEYLEKKDLKRFLIIAASSGMIVFYYLMRVFFLGHQKVGSNVSWNTEGFLAFMRSLVLQFLGDAYPRSQFFEPSLIWGLLLLVVVSGFFIWKKSRPGLEFLIIALVSIAFIEVVDLFWINLRINRYLIYLSPLMFLAVAQTWKEVKEWQVIVVLGLFLGGLLYVNPIAIYPWDDDAVLVWKEEISQRPKMQTFICANHYQSLYYDLKTVHPCIRALSELDYKRPIQMFDLNSNDRLAVLFLMERMKITHYRKVNNSLIIFFDPK